MDKFCVNCLETGCPLGLKFSGKEDNVLNLIIYEDDEKILFYNLQEKRIFLITPKDGLREICFQETIRLIDTIPQKEPDWKRVQILNLAKELGFFGIN